METFIFDKYIINTKKFHNDFAIIRVTNTETDDMYIGKIDHYSYISPWLKNQANLSINCDVNYWDDECLTIINSHPFYRCEIMKYKKDISNQSQCNSLFLLEDNKALASRIKQLEDSNKLIIGELNQIKKLLESK